MIDVLVLFLAVLGVLFVFLRPDKKLASSRNPSGDPRRLLDEADRHFHRKGYKAAETLYRQVLARDPHNSSALTQLGTISSLNGNTADAQKLFEDAAKADPSPATAYNLGLSHLQQGRYRTAVPHLEQAAETEPTLTRLLALSKACRGAGYSRKALTALERAAEIDPAPKILRLLVKEYEGSGRRRLAEQTRMMLEEAEAAGNR